MLNDTLALKRCLAALSDDLAALSETFVVDGGRSSSVEEVCRAAGAAYVPSKPGRAVQMNSGAALARGTWLWFLHADCMPAVGSAQAIAELNSKSDQPEWGCFAHRIDAAGLALRIIERTDNLRARWLRLPYGDQGIFVRRAVFEQLGGYADAPILEDLMLARTLKRRGAPRVLSFVLKTDARRWIRDGVMRTTATNWRVLWKFFVRGAPIEEIGAFYRRRTRRHDEAPHAHSAPMESAES